MPFFSKVFRTKDRDAPFSSKSKKHSHANGLAPLPPPKPGGEDAWLRKEVEPEEVQELLRGCVHEVKSRALDMPFLLLPFRPASDPVAARSFIRNYFNADRAFRRHGDRLSQELLLTEPTVLCGVMKWCWSRLPGGVVTWEAYELFRVGEQDSNIARDAFATFIPISVDSDARTKIIFDFFDLLAAIAAHGKTNGMGGRKLSRLAGWWAFGHHDTAHGFEGGYKSWSRAADAASHLFFAYLRSCSPDSIRGTNGISALPISLQTLAQATEYPPPSPTRSPTAKVVMMVDSVSPTPFALLRRARHFEYRADDQALQEFSNYEDPIQALTDECQRVLKSISSTNQSAATISKDSPGLPDASWARFEDIGFRGFGDYSDEDDEKDGFVMMKKRKDPPGLRSTPLSKGHDLGRPTTPSWADFLSSGFVDDAGDGGPAPLLLPHDKVLPPLGGDRGQSAQSHRRKVDDAALVPGELASITTIDFDDAFWWVWISSLAGEETTERKAVFGRCALIETNIRGGRWLILEEIVQGAAPEPEEGAYIAEKKSRFGFSTRGRFARTKSGSKKPPPPAKADPYARNHPAAAPASKVSIGPDQHARIQAAAAALQQKNKAHGHEPTSPRRARTDDAMDTKTNSVFTLQPVIMNEAAPAMKWANSYDKEATRATYLGNNFAGRGSTGDLRGYGANGYLSRANENAIPVPTDPSSQFKSGLTHQGLQRDDSARSGSDSAPDRDLPALPSNSKEPVPAPSQLPPSTRLVVSNGAAAAATQAAEVPLPTPTPMEGPHPLASPPVLPPKQTFDDFDEGLLNGSSPAAPEHSNGVSSQPSSPEGKGGAKKLSKPQQPGGLKGFFGGKKRPGAPTLPAPQAPADSSAVAAARAAYVGPAMKPNYGSSSSHLSRRFSTVGRKRVVPMPSGAPVRASPAEERGTQEIQAPIPITAKRFEPTNNPFGMSRSSLHVNALEPREGDGGFHRFDQGPMLDQPAFVPADSPEPPQPPSPSQQPSPPRQPSPPSATTAPPPLENHPANRTASPGEPVQPPPDSRPVIASRVEVVDASESEEESSESPPLDRWAQIRKNAAERAARQNEAKQNPGVYVEERSRPSNVTRTDDDDADGETSGEETIESRVARIKARVAELTGKIEPPSTRA